MCSAIRSLGESRSRKLRCALSTSGLGASLNDFLSDGTVLHPTVMKLTVMQLTTSSPAKAKRALLVATAIRRARQGLTDATLNGRAE